MFLKTFVLIVLEINTRAGITLAAQRRAGEPI
jgi:hypothetical protein